MAGDDILDRLRAKKEQRRLLSAELTELVREAMDEHRRTWQEVAEALDISRARVYQIKKGERQ